MARSWLDRVMTSPKDGVNPAVGDDDPQVVEAGFLRQQTHNRMLARPRPVIREIPDEEGNAPKHDGLGVGLGIAIEWDGQNRRSSRSHDSGHRRRHSDVIRFHRSIDARTGVVGSDGLLYITLGGPTTDKIWEMRAVIITYQDPWTTGPVGSQAAILSGQPATGPKISDLIMMGIAIPASVTWSHDQQVVNSGTTLYVAVHTPGASPGLFQASADVCEYDLVEYRRRRI